MNDNIQNKLKRIFLRLLDGAGLILGVAITAFLVIAAVGTVLFCTAGPLILWAHGSLWTIPATIVSIIGWCYVLGEA